MASTTRVALPKADSETQAGLLAAPTTQSAPVPSSSSSAGKRSSNFKPMEAQHFATQVPGAIFNACVEELFDLIFRDFGPGSFQDTARSGSGSCWLDPPPSWQPQAQEGAASAPTHRLGQPQATMRVRRPVVSPNWVRYFMDLPEHCVADEHWTLYGLGQNSALLIQIQDTVSGIPYADCFVVWRRYRLTRVGETRTQLDAEFEVEWVQQCMVQTKLERATVEQLTADFRNKFLPLVKRFLASCFKDNQHLPLQGIDAGLHISPQEWTLTIGSLDGSSCSTARETDPASPIHVAQYEIAVSVHSIQVTVEAASIFGFANVFVLELQLGGRSVRTCACNCQQGLRAVFSNELFLLGYLGEQHLRVRVLEWHRLRLGLAGQQHLAFGEGDLALDKHFQDLEPRGIVLPVWNGEKHTGMVQLQYQALLLSNLQVVGEGTAASAIAACRQAFMRVKVFGAAVEQRAQLHPLEELLSLPAEQIFTEFELGSRCVRTQSLPMPGDGQSVTFIEELLIFAYGGEGELEVRLCTCRWPEGFTDKKLIGSATLDLRCSLHSCEPQTVELAVSMSGVVTGKVSLIFQLFV